MKGVVERGGGGQEQVNECSKTRDEVKIEKLRGQKVALKKTRMKPDC